MMAASQARRRASDAEIRTPASIEAPPNPVSNDSSDRVTMTFGAIGRVPLGREMLDELTQADAEVFRPAKCRLRRRIDEGGSSLVT